MRRWIAVALAAFTLAACGGSPAQALTAQQVVDKFATAGIELTDVKTDERSADSPLPNSYKEQLGFNDEVLGDKGGQVFVCDTAQNCDAIYAYFDALKALAGPYLYKSPSGTTVVQLNSGFTPEQAKRYEEIVKTLP